MKNLKFRCRPLLITILIAIAFCDIEARTYSSSYATRSAYRRTYTGSSYSGSNSAGKLAMSTTMCIVIPIVVVTAVLLLVFCIPVQVRQREKASKLEKIQFEMESKAITDLYSEDQSLYEIAPTTKNNKNAIICQDYQFKLFNANYS